jgi:hypothetical protein
MSSHLARWLFQSRAGLLVASGSVVAASTTAGIVLSDQVTHTGVLGQKITKPTASTSAGGSDGNTKATTNVNGNGNGNGNNAGPPGKAFTMTVQAVGTIGPGQHQTLNVTVLNPNNQNMQITGATGVVNSVSKASCLPTWFTVEDWTPGASPTIAPANGTAHIQMKLDFTDLPTNQDVCKSTPASPVTISFTLHASGAQA